MKKAPNSQNSEKPEKGHNEAVGAFFKDLGKCHPMSREEEQVLMAEMVRIRDERDLLVEAINQKNPEDISEDEDVQTLQAIGHRFGVSRERIRQIDNEIRRRLRKKLMQAIEAPEVV